MDLTFLGTGTSYGVPVIGCDCPVCTSTDPRNTRRRSALYVKAEGVGVVIDTPPDFRDQALRFGVDRVDAVLLTHAHADHIHGFDDLRRFCRMQDMTIPVYGAPATLEHMRQRFYYVREEPNDRETVPSIRYVPMHDPDTIGPFRVTPIPAWHGEFEVYGYLIEHATGRIGYVPDCSELPAGARRTLAGVDVMILDATRKKPHPTHYSTGQSIEVMREIGADRSYLAHLGHDYDHEESQKTLPPGFHLPYDGLRLHFPLSAGR